MSQRTDAAASIGWRSAPLDSLIRSRDVGLVRLRSALRVAATVTAGMLAGYAIASVLGMPAVEGLMLGALPAFLTCFAINDETARREVARCAVLLVPFIAATTLAVLLHPFRLVELVVVVVLLSAQFFSAGLNSWLADAGMGAFSAYLCGLLLPISTGSLPGIAIVFAASLAATILIRLAFFRPDARRALRSARRSFVLCAEAVLTATVGLLTADDEGARRRADRRFERRLDRMQNAALIVDGLIAADRSGARGQFALDLHQVLFDGELAVETLARTARALGARDPRLRPAAAAAIGITAAEGADAGIRAADELLARLRADGLLAEAEPDAVRAAHRLAATLRGWAGTAEEWARMRARVADAGDIPFESAIDLVGGRVAGAAPVLDATLEGEGMSGPWRRLRITSAARTAVQALVAVALVEPIALLLGADRFYWGVIGVVVILAGTSSTHERVRKTWSRIWGTALGGAIGIPLAALVGGTPWLVAAVAVLGLALGIYFIPVRYGLWTAFLVVALCMVYAASTGLDAGLIALRLTENAVGAVIAVLVSLVVLPVGSPAMVRTAIAAELDAVREAIVQAGSGERRDLRSAARAVDLAQYRLESVLRPMISVPAASTRRRDDQTSAVLESAALYVAYLAAQAQPVSTPPDAELDRVREAADRLATSVTVLRDDVLAGGATRGTWTRIADTRLREIGLETTVVRVVGDDAAPGGAPARGWADERVRLLARIDEALAALAARRGLAVEG